MERNTRGIGWRKWKLNMAEVCCRHGWNSGRINKLRFKNPKQNKANQRSPCCSESHSNTPWNSLFPPDADAWKLLRTTDGSRAAPALQPSACQPFFPTMALLRSITSKNEVCTPESPSASSISVASPLPFGKPASWLPVQFLQKTCHSLPRFRG